MTVEGKFNSAGANLLKMLIAQIEKLPKPWLQLSASEQERVIFHMREAVESSVRTVVKTIASGDFMNIPASVDSVTFKDGVKAVLKLAKGSDTHVLADAQGGQVLIVIASPNEYIDGIENVKAKADQSELFEQHDIDVDTPQTNVSGDPSLDKAAPDSGVPQFVFGLLASVGVHVAIETVKSWTKEELTVAAGWADAFAKTPMDEMCPIARPHWLPIPDLSNPNTDETIVLSSDDTTTDDEEFNDDEEHEDEQETEDEELPL